MGLLAAALFGVSAPISKRLLGGVSPQVLAGLLYLGAGLALTLYRALRPAVLMLFGLQRTSAVTSSLLLNLEAPFTIALAVLVFREHLGRYAAGAMALILAGAAILRLQPGAHRADTPGVLLLAGACAAWALDNNLTQRLSLRDPFALVRVKTLAAGSFNLALGLLIAGRMPSPRVTMAALALGSVSYGASVVLNERPGWSDGLAMAVMAAGVALLLRERHGHGHAHEALDHAHAHVHDEHHQHAHGPDDPAGEPHAHTHHHAPLAHDHAHTPDAHHRHRH